VFDFLKSDKRDPKINGLEKSIAKIKVFESSVSAIITGTEANKSRLTLGSMEDVEEELQFHEKLIKKTSSDLQKMLEYYYDSVFEKKFINEVDDFRKSINKTIKALATYTVTVKCLTEISKQKS
jgi:hypothetical protein